MPHQSTKTQLLFSRLHRCSSAYLCSGVSKIVALRRQASRGSAVDTVCVPCVLSQCAFLLVRFCFVSCSKLYAVGMRQSTAWGLYLVAGTTAQTASIALSLLLGGSMVYNGAITPEQLTSFMFYVQVRVGQQQ